MPLRLHGDVVEQAGRASAMADLGGCGGGFATLDALEPVPVLIVALIEMHLVGLEGIVVEIKNRVQVIVSFEWMARSVAISLDATDVETLR